MKSPKRVLEPHDRIAEVLFGLIMVLTFTGSLSIAEAGRDDVRTMLIGALGCNLAWGLIDGVFYLMSCLAEKGRELQTLRAVRTTQQPRTAQQLVADALPPTIASVLSPEELDQVQQRLRQLPEPASTPRLTRAEWQGAVAVSILVFLSTFPVAVPFMFLANAALALRISNAVAIVMLFAAGAAYGRCIGRSPWPAGLAMVLLGGLLVGLTIALGG